MSFASLREVKFDHLLEGRPSLLIDEGKLRRPALDAHGLDDEDLKEAARLSHGLTDVREVRQATLERDGKISIVPWRGKREWANAHASSSAS